MANISPYTTKGGEGAGFAINYEKLLLDQLREQDGAQATRQKPRKRILNELERLESTRKGPMNDEIELDEELPEIIDDDSFEMAQNY